MPYNTDLDKPEKVVMKTRVTRILDPEEVEQLNRLAAAKKSGFKEGIITTLVIQAIVLFIAILTFYN